MHHKMLRATEQPTQTEREFDTLVDGINPLALEALALARQSYRQSTSDAEELEHLYPRELSVYLVSDFFADRLMPSDIR